MKCLTTVHYYVLVNGNPTDYILPSQGLRQGRLLSPYLFLLCVKGLTTLIWKAEVKGMIRGTTTLIWKAKVKGIIRGTTASRGGPYVSHLLFANDSLLFYCGSMEESQPAHSK